MRTALLLATLLVAPLLVVTGGAAAPAPGCSSAPLPEAARALIHPGAEVARVDADGALVLAPLVHPGVRFRLVEHDGAWCDAQRAQWTTGSALERAAAYARVAAAPWFDGVEVLEAAQTLPGLVTLTTHARTNGVVASWSVAVDALGIREATWTATAFAVPPFDAEPEGLTALPGASKTFLRGADGALAATTPLLPAVSPPSVTLTATDRMSDGVVFQYFLGGVGVYPTLGEPFHLDVFRAVTRENYEAFLQWGLVANWTPNRGAVHIDDALAFQCFACVAVGPNFNIHVSSQIVPILRALGYTFPDDRAAIATVMGHEMMHNWQSSYARPAGGHWVGGAFSEGTARFSETLHTYSWVSHQPGSLVYADDSNGCNDELGPQSGSRVLADGPATNHSYSACAFWLAFYANHGVTGVRRLLEASPHHMTKVGWPELKGIIEEATGASVDGDLARYASVALTGKGLVWGPAAGGGPALDWGAHLLRWTPTALSPGAATTQTARDGGMVGARFVAAATLDVSATGAVVYYTVLPDGTYAPTADGAAIAAGTWVVALRPDAGAATVTIRAE